MAVPSSTLQAATAAPLSLRSDASPPPHTRSGGVAHGGGSGSGGTDPVVERLDLAAHAHLAVDLVLEVQIRWWCDRIR